MLVDLLHDGAKVHWLVDDLVIVWYLEEEREREKEREREGGIQNHQHKTIYDPGSHLRVVQKEWHSTTLKVPFPF